MKLSNLSHNVLKTPWDSRIFGIETYEIRSISKEVLREIKTIPGHYTVKVDPLSSKKILNDHGFYYCDTLIEPYCAADRFIFFKDEKISISRSIPIDKLIEISHGAFYGRFHRDFNIDKTLADLRYDSWLKELYESGNFFSLMYHNELAGFFGYAENKILLHALDKNYKGKGLAKCFWSVACKELYEKGHSELTSSISSSNIPALNLYASLGFSFRNALDVYHLLIA